MIVIVVVVVIVVLVFFVALAPLLGMLLMALFRAHHMLLVTDLVPHRFMALALPLPDIFRVVFA
jgi:hypothetical protein